CEPSTPPVVGLKTTFHETTALWVTLTVVLVVEAVAGEAASVNGIVSVSRRIPLPVAPQSGPSYSVNEKLPLRLVSVVQLAEAVSFGSQSCSDVVIDVS